MRVYLVLLPTLCEIVLAARGGAVRAVVVVFVVLVSSGIVGIVQILN